MTGVSGSGIHDLGYSKVIFDTEYNTIQYFIQVLNSHSELNQWYTHKMSSCCNHNSHHADPASPSCHSHSAKPWYRQTLFLVAIASVASIWIVQGMVPTSHAVHHFKGYLLEMGIPIILGLFLGGVIDYFVPKEYIQQLLAQQKKRTLVYSVILGLFFSVCSHGILAIAIQLYKKGASIASVITFLLASPWTSLPITFMLIQYFGWKSALVIGLAIVVALITGYCFQQLEKRNQLERSPYQTPDTPSINIMQNIKSRFHQTQFDAHWVSETVKGVIRSAWDLTQMVLWWILIGLVAAVLIRVFIPTTFINQYFGPTPVGMLLTLLSATVIEVCSEGSAPIAFELYNLTHALGNVFVFLMAGVATDYTEIGLIWTTIGRKTAILLPLISVIQIFIIGIVLNTVF